MVLRLRPPHTGLKASSTTQWSICLIYHTVVLTSLPRCDSAKDKPPWFTSDVTGMLWCNKWQSKMTHHWRHRHVVTQQMTMQDDSPVTSLAGPHKKTNVKARWLTTDVNGMLWCNKWQSKMTHQWGHWSVATSRHSGYRFGQTHKHACVCHICMCLLDNMYR